MLVVEDTSVVDDTATYNDLRPLYRTVYGLNDFGRTLREVVIEDPTGAEDDEDPIKCWCSAWTYVQADVDYDDDVAADGGDGDFNDEGDARHLKHRVAEYRLPAAYDVSTMHTLRLFLDPYDDPNTNGDGTSGGWANDAGVRWDSAGTTYIFDYIGHVNDPDTALGLRFGTRVQNGQLSDAHFESFVTWGTDAPGGSSNDLPPDRIVASYVYPEATTNPLATSRIQTKYEYDFYDSADTQLKRKTTLVPKVGSNENGPGTSASDPDLAEVIAKDEFFDEEGRLRWEKDGEGYVNYYSYHPSTGGLAYVVTDVDTSSPPGDIASGSANKWLAWSGGVPSGFTRSGVLPTALQIVRKYEYDAQGREVLRIDPPTDSNDEGAIHYTAYEAAGSLGGVERTIHFPYWNSTSHLTGRPIQVRELDSRGRLSAEYSLPAGFSNIDVPSGEPVGLGTVNASDCVSLTRYNYDDHLGRLMEVRRYHDTSGDTPFTHFYSTHYLHDAEGRVGAVIEDVESEKYQVTVTLYDVQGRPIETRRGVVANPPVTPGSPPTVNYDYADLSDPTTLFSGTATISKTVYDNGYIGDGHVTSMKQFYGTSPTEFVETIYHRTFLGHVRGIETRNNTSDVKPYVVNDIDWLGRTKATAQYTTEPTWSTVLGSGGYADYVSGNSSGRYNRLYSFYDVLGRIYRTDNYPGNSSNTLRTSNYYDLNDQLVATGDPYSAHTEYAYDCAGRRYQTRTVLIVSSPAYVSGKFDYRLPAPTLAFASMTSGNEGVIELSHTTFDAAGNVTEQHAVELNHDDTNGISLTSGTPTGGVRSTVYSWHDAADRVTTMANYGSDDGSDGGSSDNNWASKSLPTRGTAPSSSMAAILVSKYDYDTAGRLQTVIDSAGIETKAFYDDLGRRIFVAENQNDFEGSSSGTGIGGGSGDEDRVTKWEYNGFDAVTKLTAYNGGFGSTQETEYKYADSYNASLVTLTKYPDGNTTVSTGFDNVQFAYYLDGLPDTMKDQRGVVHTYTYDNARRLSLDGATTIPSGVDGTIKSIGRTYTDLGEPLAITSYANNNGSGTVENQIEYSYSTERKISQIKQSHQNAVTSGTPFVSFGYDTTAASNVFTNGLRKTSIYYPVQSDAHLELWYGGTDSITDRLHRSAYEKLWDGSLSSVGAQTSWCYYNGTNRFVGLDTESNNGTYVRLEMNSSSGNYAGFDRFGRTAQMTWRSRWSWSVIEQVKYGYDLAGNRKWREDVVAASQTVPVHQDEFYSYDGLHRLVAVDRGNLTGTPYTAVTSTNRTEDWTLDQLGNWGNLVVTDGTSTTLNQTRYHNSVNEIDTDITDGDVDASITGTPNWADPVYDKAGNTTTFPITVTTRGLVYDAWNRLATVAAPGVGVVVAYEYDGLGQRIRNDVISVPTREYFYNEKWQLLTETKSGGVEAVYHWHPFYVDALAARMRASDSHSFLFDANFNVTAAVSDASDAVVERYNYTPYGTPTVLNLDFSLDSSGGGDGVSDIANNHLYTGRERDPTGLQLNRHRYYASELGRWLTRDPIGYAAGDLSLYQYVGGMPTRYVDPTGEFAPVAVAVAIGIGMFFWPDPANAPAPGDHVEPATGIGLPAGVIVGAGGAGARAACKAVQWSKGGEGGGGARPSTDRRPNIEGLEQRGVPGPGPGPVPVPPRGGNVPRPIQSNPPAPAPTVIVGPPIPGVK